MSLFVVYVKDSSNILVQDRIDSRDVAHEFIIKYTHFIHIPFTFSLTSRISHLTSHFSC